MENKKTYIDGVDVSGCIYFKMNNKIPMCRACNSGVGSPYCEYHKDCYYKQLNRKEQECEELKEDRERWKSNFNGKVSAIEELLQQLDQLGTRNEELKKQLQAQRAFTRHEQKLIYCVAYDETCKTGNDCKQEKCIFKDNIKLKQTLTEIKGIAEEQIPYLNIDKAKTII